MRDYYKLGAHASQKQLTRARVAGVEDEGKEDWLVSTVLTLGAVAFLFYKAGKAVS